MTVLLAGPARAQPARDSPSAPPRRIVLSFEQRTRVEALTHPFRVDELGPTRLVALRSRLQVRLPTIVGPLGAYVELQDSRGLWSDRPFIARARHVNPLDFTQAFVQVGPRPLLGTPARGGLQLGRFTLDLGRRRLVARNNMRNTTNAFDGARGWLAFRELGSLDVFFSQPVRLDPDRLDRSEARRLLWGTSTTWRRWPSVQADLYALRLDESGDTETRRRLITLGCRLYRSPSPGRPDYEIEAAWQWGRVQGKDHHAHLLHAEAGHVFPRGSVRLAVLFDHASGDADPEDGSSQRFDTLFGARAFEYAPTGIYGPFFRSNILGPGTRIRLAPSPRFEITLAHRALWLARARDTWVGSGLQDSTGAAGRFLGNHLETWLRWRLRPGLLAEAGYSHFFKGPYLDEVPGSPRGPDSDYFTLGLALGGPLLAR